MDSGIERITIWSRLDGYACGIGLLGVVSLFIIPKETMSSCIVAGIVCVCLLYLFCRGQDTWEREHVWWDNWRIRKPRRKCLFAVAFDFKSSPRFLWW